MVFVVGKLILKLVIVEVKIWGEQPTVELLFGKYLGDLHRRTKVNGRGEDAQNSSNMQIRPRRQGDNPSKNGTMCIRCVCIERTFQ